jgi:hypothetical protein
VRCDRFVGTAVIGVPPLDHVALTRVVVTDVILEFGHVPEPKLARRALMDISGHGSVSSIGSMG